MSITTKASIAKNILQLAELGQTIGSLLTEFHSLQLKLFEQASKADNPQDVADLHQAMVRTTDALKLRQFGDSVKTLQDRLLVSLTTMTPQGHELKSTAAAVGGLPLPAYAYRSVTKTSAKIVDADTRPDAMLRIMSFCVESGIDDVLERRLKVSALVNSDGALNRVGEALYDEALIIVDQDRAWSITKAKA